MSGHHAGRQHSAGADCPGNRGLWVVLRNHGGQYRHGRGVSGAPSAAQVTGFGDGDCRCGACKSGRLVNPAPSAADHAALLVQQNIPILEGADWTKDYFERTLRDLTTISLTAGQSWTAPRPHRVAGIAGALLHHRSHIPRCHHQSCPGFADLGAERKPGRRTTPRTRKLQAARSITPAPWCSPDGSWVSRYDKVHLVPFGEYVPFRQIFSFASGLTEQVGDFARGKSRAPLLAGRRKARRLYLLRIGIPQ